MLLFPADPTNIRRVDEHFAPQAQAARELGHTVRLVNLAALERATGEPILRWPALDEPVRATYRGWMVTPENYARLAELLLAKGAVLATSPPQYQRAHELPGWYDALRAFTPKTVEIEATTLASVQASLSHLGTRKAFVRDYSKSLKHEPAASIVEDASDASAALETVALFSSLRGEALAGRVLLREFEPFVGPEARTWWVEGNLRLVTPHPDTPTSELLVSALLSEAKAHLPSGLAEAVGQLDLPFVTVDVARRTDGQLRVVELGDGQVSDVPGTVDLEVFYSTVLPPEA